MLLKNQKAGQKLLNRAASKPAWRRADQPNAALVAIPSRLTLQAGVCDGHNNLAT